LGLGWRLGLLTTLVVTGVMAVLTGAQLAVELRSELRERRAQLRESLAPLVTDLRRAYTRDDVRMALERFHASYVDEGHTYHDLAIAHSSGRVVIDTRSEGRHGPQALLTAGMPLVSPAFGRQPVILSITEDSFDYSVVRMRRWRDWALHVSLTALLIMALLNIVIRREVTRPIDRLLSGVRKMELGYWDDLPDPGGAWEVRWLGWRFRTLGQELSRTVEHLVAAQRRAYAVDRDAVTEPDASGVGLPADSVSVVYHEPDTAIRRLEAQLERLRGADPGEPATRSLAQVTWDHHTTQAERLGQPELCISLGNAALRVLDPDGYLNVSGRIEAERPRLEALARTSGAQIHGALAARDVSVVEIRHRVKHPAGIWKKMHHKHLEFEQVHDLVALRIVVPTETDCYYALGVVHDLHVPVVGRFKDYIVQPKPNGYRGLHTSVRAADGSVFEVQIRSIAMNAHAEQGSAAHADYKDATWIPVSSGRDSPWKRLLALFGASPDGRTRKRGGLR
jgi:HAMP domain-containing protein